MLWRDAWSSSTKSEDVLASHLYWLWYHHLARQAVAATAEAEARIVAVDLQVTRDDGRACTRTAAVVDD